MGIRTTSALLARGFDSNLAERLSNSGFTLSKLKSMREDELIALGLKENEVQILQKEPRSNIPAANISLVLSKNKRTCCVCRQEHKSVILHHINEWAKSKDHSCENLAVLCLDCHDQAHSKSKLSINLTKEHIKDYKSNWERDIQFLNAQTILNLRKGSDIARWDWINIIRVFELLKPNKIQSYFKNTDVINKLREYNVIDQYGYLKEESKWKVGKENQMHFIDFLEGSYIASYLSGVLEFVLSSTPVIDITPILNKRTEIKSLVKKGSYILIQAAFYFNTIQESDDSRNEVRSSYYQGYGVKVNFTYRPWFCMSCSSKISSMSGRNVQTVFGFVRNISTIDGELCIELSCLGAGTFFERHPDRVVSTWG